MTVHIAVDIGGTRMRAALYTTNRPAPVTVKRINTRKKNIPPRKRLKKLIASIWPADERVSGIGIAVPGPVDPAAGTVKAAPNLPEWTNFPIANYLRQTFSVPVALGNDANLAALGEWQFGAGRGHNFLLYLTISTGIGSGIILDAKPFSGANGYASELGHVLVEPDGPLCSCGVRGHLEAVASGTAISRWVAEQIRSGARTRISWNPASGEPIPGTAIAEAARRGDPLSIAAYHRAGRYLGQAIADFLHTFNPTLVILGGGVSQSYTLFADALHNALQEHIMSSHFLTGLQIVTAQLGDDAGLMGALALARMLTADT